MSLSNLTLRAIFALVCAAFLAVGAHAQFKASIQGTIMDPKGGAVTGAKLTVTDQATGVSHDTVTNDQGFYRVNELPPGSYTVTVEAAGFKQSISKDLLVQAEQPRGFDITLAVGTVSEQITVSATNEGLQTEDANIATTISKTEIE